MDDERYEVTVKAKAETFLPIPGFPGYEVGSHGTVWSKKRNRPIGDGARVTLHGTNGNETVNIRSLVRDVHGIELPAPKGKTGPNLTDEDKARIRDLYEKQKATDKVNYAQIGREVGRHYSTIYRVIHGR